MKSCFKWPSCCEMFLIIFISSGSFSLSALFISIFKPFPVEQMQIIENYATVYTSNVLTCALCFILEERRHKPSQMI